MSQKHTISGRRSALIWLSVLIVLVVAVVLVVTVLFIYPSYQRQQQVEQHYQTGVAFQDVGDWDKAVEAFEKVVAIDATYKDARTRLAEAKSKQQEALAQVQAKAAQATATAQTRAEATAAAATVEAGIVQATSVAATATAQARATAQAQEAKATATAEALAQLEAHYQKGLGYMNLERWEEAKAELKQVFDVEPNYKDIQAKLAQVEAELEKLTPTHTPTPMGTPTPTRVPITDTPIPPTPTPVRPSPTPTLTPVVILYQADWSNGLNGWFGSKDWKTVNGMLVNDGTNNSIHLSITSPYAVAVDDYAIEAEIQVVQPPGCSSFGIIGRGDGKGGGHAIGINYCEFRGAAFYSNPAIGYKEFNPGFDWHTYRIEMKGNVIRYLIDGALALQMVDNRYLSGGQIGLWDDEVQLQIRSFKVLQLEK